MCGICGIFGPDVADKGAWVGRMNTALFHRGPDGAGQYDGPLCSHAMRRLAIIDLSGGQQPIENEDGTLNVVFNGEIYNYRELRQELLARGHQLKTESDTEVLVHLYEEHGTDMPRYLKGMFAFSLLDLNREQLLLARDRFGEKPLYYFIHPKHGLIYSSEIKSLLAHPDVPRRLNREALAYFMRVGYVPEPLTLFDDIRSLPPGHSLLWRDGRAHIAQWFHIDYRPDPALTDPRVACEAVQAELLRAVARQSISDVPLGAFLSGGIDSSAVASVLARHVETQGRVKTFTIRFEEMAYDESAIARDVATHLDTEHREFTVGNVQFETDDLWRIIDHVGLPFCDSSAIPTYILSQHVRDEVTVALSGDGGDELFAGYNDFIWGQTILRAQSQLPRPLRQLGSTTLAGLTQTGLLGRRASQLRRYRRGLDASLLLAEQVPIAIGAYFDAADLQPLLADAAVRDAALGRLPLLTTLPDAAAEWSPLRRLMYYRIKHELPGKMLTKVDRMSMANSLEVRAPLLDADLAELSFRLPDEHLIQNGKGKHILRESVRADLPNSVFDHPKKGFGIPLHRFQNAAYREIASKLLSTPAMHELFRPNALQSIIDAGISQTADRADRSVYRSSHQLWCLMQLGAWIEKFGVGI